MLPADSALGKGHTSMWEGEGRVGGLPGVRATWEPWGGGGPQKGMWAWGPNKSHSQEGTGGWLVTAAS